MTGAYNISQYYRSDFVRLTTVRITQESISAVRIVSSPFIGKPNNGVNRSALEAAIDEGLGKLQRRGALEGFRFSLISTPTMRALGQIIVDLTIIPAFEITEIRVRIGLSIA
jgi:phage tail sheath protein FI